MYPEIMTKDNVLTITFRYERELHPTRWSSIRQGALVGVFVGWLSLLSYLVYAVGFIFGSILMSSKSNNTFNISDILVVSALYQKIII
jgi:hypothetical protein